MTRHVGKPEEFARKPALPCCETHGKHFILCETARDQSKFSNVFQGYENKNCPRCTWRSISTADAASLLFKIDLSSSHVCMFVSRKRKTKQKHIIKVCKLRISRVTKTETKVSQLLKSILIGPWTPWYPKLHFRKKVCGFFDVTNFSLWAMFN